MKACCRRQPAIRFGVWRFGEFGVWGEGFKLGVWVFSPDRIPDETIDYAKSVFMSSVRLSKKFVY